MSEPSLTCRAPSVAMHFSLAGHVHACCQNGAYSFGDVSETPLLEIWQGQRRAVMADDLAVGRYPVGCEVCEVEHELGHRASTPAQAFDQFADGPAAWPRQLEFTLSNRCNLACVQCNGDNSSTIRAKREGRPPMPMPYTDGFFEQLPPFLEEVEVVSFLGGEPFLAPEAKRVWDLLLAGRHRPVVRVTTNATVWSDAIERYVYGLEMHLAVSIDGATAETYDAIRVGAHYDRVVEIRDRMLAATRSYGGTFHLNYCLLRSNWHEVGRFLHQADELDVDANIIPVFGPADHSVFTLPEAELRPIVAKLIDEDRTLGRRLGRNRPRWEGVLRMLQDQVARAESDASRETLLSAIRGERTRVAARLEAERREREERLEAERMRRSVELAGEGEAALRAWAGQECIEVTVEHDVVQAVRVPGWAAPLDVDAWVGADIASIGPTVAARLGQVEYSEPRDLSVGDGLVVVNDSVLTSPRGRHRFRTLYAPRLGRMVIATPDAIVL